MIYQKRERDDDDRDGALHLTRSVRLCVVFMLALYLIPCKSSALANHSTFQSLLLLSST
jgi:hypothetical protein